MNRAVPRTPVGFAMSGRSPSVDPDRLWEAHLRMAEIGPTPEGGSCRLALSPEDAQARALLLRMVPDAEPALPSRTRSATCSSAAMAATTAAPAVAFGSHLDTVPTGGRFDGVIGVLAGLEAMRALEDAGITTRAPLELVNWTNEEGAASVPP